MKRNFARTCGKCRSLMMLVLLMSFGTGLVLPADISGTWTFTVHTDGGDAHPTFIFKQEGEKLTGTYSGPMGEAKVTGTLKGNSASVWKGQRRTKRIRQRATPLVASSYLAPQTLEAARYFATPWSALHVLCTYALQTSLNRRARCAPALRCLSLIGAGSIR